MQLAGQHRRQGRRAAPSCDRSQGELRQTRRGADPGPRAGSGRARVLIAPPTMLPINSPATKQRPWVWLKAAPQLSVTGFDIPTLVASKFAHHGVLSVLAESSIRRGKSRVHCSEPVRHIQFQLLRRANADERMYIEIFAH